MKNIEVEFPKNIKKTAQRIEIFEILKKNNKPISISTINKLVYENNSDIALSTIYRILEKFSTSKIVTKTKIMNSNTYLYELNFNVHKHYAICENCEKIINISCCPLENFNPKLDENEFKITGHKVEYYGICSDCQ